MRRFFIVFFGLLLLLFGLEITQPVQEHVVLPFTAQLANLCTSIIHLFDSQAISEGKVVYNPINGMGVSIEPGCNGVEACIMLIAAVVAFPATWHQRLIGIGIGLVAIQLLNVVRIFSLFYLLQWNQAWFDFFHSFLWQALIMLDVLVVFLFWIRRYPLRRADERTPAHALG